MLQNHGPPKYIAFSGMFYQFTPTPLLVFMLRERFSCPLLSCVTTPMLGKMLGISLVSNLSLLLKVMIQHTIRIQKHL